MRATTSVLRVLAILIALVGAVDPSVTSSRRGKPNVAVFSASARDSALADRVASSLADRFTAVRAPFSAADAGVLVGNQLSDDTRGVAFAVVDDAPSVSLEAVHAPAAASAESRVSVATTARVTGARGKTLELTLRSGNLVVDRVTRTIASDDERVASSLTFVPPRAGESPLRVSAAIAGESRIATTDLVVDVRDQRWSVLFFDPRPSWMSTFVRRAVERDPRFVATSRIVTSRNVSTDAGRPPARLDDLASLALFDAIVVGAPEALSEQDVNGLEAFMRRRGGSVVLLFDRRASGPYERLASVASWISDSTSRAVAVVLASGDSAALRASELAFPARLPVGATPLASTAGARADSINARPIVWRAPVGAGRLVVSGALDSWRYRDAAVSGFDRFWLAAIADAAAAAPPPIGSTLSSATLRPGERTEVSVVVRDAALATSNATRASAGASLESDSTPPVAIRLFPGASPGRFHGSVRAPTSPGIYRVVVAGDGARATSPLVVADDASHPTPDDRDLVDAWARTHRGRAIAASKLEELAPALASTITVASRTETWHPMRSVWWILPFALFLSAEWFASRVILMTRSAIRMTIPSRTS